MPAWLDGVERSVAAGDVARGEYFLLDLGESWTPLLFSDGEATDGTALRHEYRETYLALAQGRFGEDRHGRRARRDGDLELFGIQPTLSLHRKRMAQLSELACIDHLDLSPLDGFDGRIAVSTASKARKRARVLSRLTHRVQRGRASDAETAEYERLLKRASVVRTSQARLVCEGWLEADAKEVQQGFPGHRTRRALRAFERHHGIASSGVLGGQTLAQLRVPPREGERLALLRTLTLRATHTLGVVEDGSSDATYVDDDGRRRPVPNLSGQLREQLEQAFGLHTAQATQQWLGSLELAEHKTVAVRRPVLPSYYSSAMDLSIDYDRGDVWYDFPFNAVGRRRAQPVTRRPTANIYVQYGAQRILLARFPTTIGGWQNESVDGVSMWKYKNSPVGERVWSKIVAAPVWLPPASMPDDELLTRNGRRLRRNLIGPSHASAYGLAVAYHRTIEHDEDGSLQVGLDQGIRTHGSAAYSSIGRGNSHGCHRLHNQTAVRLMSFVLARRPHRRIGHEAVRYHRKVASEAGSHTLRVERGGYAFELEQPLRVRVNEGRIRGRRGTPIRRPLPQYDREAGAYVMADGTHVRIRSGVPVPIHPQPPLELVAAPAGAPQPAAAPLPPSLPQQLPPMPDATML